MAKQLTAPAVERLKPDPTKRLEIPDGLLPGLYFVLQPSGAKSWAVRYRHGGKPRKLTLGAYPVLDLTKARANARTALQAVAEGRDPGEEKQEAKRSARDEKDTVAAQVESFLARHTRKHNKARTAEEVERVFRLHVIPAWGERRVQDITRRDVVDLLDKLVDAGKPVAANRTLAHVRKLFNWLIDRSVLDASPVVRVKAPAPEKSRDRVLIDNELRLIWKAAERVGFPFGPMVQMLMLTAQRRDEVAGMRRRELKEDSTLWHISAERTKNSVEQDVPLPAVAQAILTALPLIGKASGYVFTTTGETPVSGYSNAKERLDAAMLAIAREEAKERGEDPEEVKLEPWRLHDLRRTAASGMARLGFPVHVIEAVLNHRSGQVSGVAAVYNRHSYLPEKRRALEAWADHVQTILL
jgi:integrase